MDELGLMYNLLNSFYFEGYKAFTVGRNELKELRLMNVLIGKNNSGKTSVLDIVSAIIDVDEHWNRYDKIENFGVDTILSNSKIQSGFKTNVGHGLRDIALQNNIPMKYNGMDYEYGKNFIGYKMRCKLSVSKSNNMLQQNFSYLAGEPSEDEYVNCPLHDEGTVTSLWNAVAASHNSIYGQCKIRRLGAERNIVPEKEGSNEILTESGNGASNLIRKFINQSDFSESLVEVDLLNALNRIMVPDAKYNRIQVQQVPTSEGTEDFEWEVYLEEEHVGRIPLSQSGSGLKTIILVLLNLLIIPETRTYSGKTIFYAFEELENNLHPALQRRLFDFLYEFSVNNNTMIFLTTHSHVAINAFFGKEEAAIFHVAKDELEVSRIRAVDDYLSKANILNDLDVRASDLLQANGIIWVEGPTDRLYIKKWLEVFCNCELEEGKDFQFLYYGGRLLSHYTAIDDVSVNDLINVLTTNRNSAIVMDSDLLSEQEQINETKKRIRSEFEERNLFYWIIAGKEIENYISYKSVNSALGINRRNQCGQYKKFPEYIKSDYNGFENNKMAFAQQLIGKADLNTFENVLDLEERIKELYDRILSWNNLS